MIGNVRGMYFQRVYVPIKCLLERIYTFCFHHCSRLFFSIVRKKLSKINIFD